MRKNRQIFIISPFNYTLDYDLALLDSLIKEGEKYEVHYFCSSIGRNIRPTSNIHPIFFKTYSAFKVENSTLKQILKVLSIVEYTFTMLFLIFKAKREHAKIHIMWIKHPLIDYPFNLLIKLLSISLYYTVHNAFPHDCKSSSKKKLYVAYYKRCDKLIFLSQNELKKVEEILHQKIKNAYVIPHGILMQETPFISTIHARTKLDLPKDKPIIAFVGLIRPYKGLFTLIEALKMARKKFDAHLIIVGKNSLDKNETSKLYNECRSKWIYFKEGYQTHETLRDVICASDLIVQPYKEASQSGISFCTLRYNKPMICTSVGNLGETVPNILKRNIVPPNSPEALSDSISDYLTKKDEIYTELKKEINTLKGIFSWSNIANEHLEKIYE